MMRPEDVDSGLVEKAARAMRGAHSRGRLVPTWEGTTETVRGEWCNDARHALAAVLPEIQAQAWEEGMEATVRTTYDPQPLVNPYRAAHQPAPEPEPEYRPYALYLAKVHDIPDQRVMWTSDRHHPWMSLSPVASERWHSVNFVTDVHPLVVLDPESDTDRLSNIIREVDGNHDLGAGGLAEAILQRLAR